MKRFPCASEELAWRSAGSFVLAGWGWMVNCCSCSCALEPEDFDLCVSLVSLSWKDWLMKPIVIWLRTMR